MDEGERLRDDEDPWRREDVRLVLCWKEKRREESALVNQNALTGRWTYCIGSSNLESREW